MEVIDPGHLYSLQNYNPDTKAQPFNDTHQTITFVKRFRDEANHPGTLNQELIRVLINRVEFLDKEVPWEGNKQILHHLRMALVLHESRALSRKVEKGDILPEDLETGPDGHILLKFVR